MTQQAIVAILGPTASGKSRVAMELAQALGGEIISCDSMQVYRELEIGTAKPSRADLARVPHHLVNCVSFTERYDTNRFVIEAVQAARDISSRGKLPIVVGGTGLYAKALLYGYRLQPASSEVFDAVCRQAATTDGVEALRDELRQGDPGGSLPADTYVNVRRLIRAVEILRIERARDAECLDSAPAAISKWMKGICCRQFVLLPETSELRGRIEARTRQMLRRGWRQEATRLVHQGLLATPTAYQALGYREMAAWDPQHGSLEEMAQLIVTKTWQYARRQMTWFRRQHPGACLLTLRKNLDLAEISRAIITQVQIFLSSY